MTEQRKISAGQLMLLLVLARIMHTMIYRFDDFTSGVPIMFGLLVATAIEAVAAIPAVLFFCAGGSDPAAEIGGRFAPIVKALYSFYFTVIAGGTIALFAEFLQKEFSHTIAPIAAILLLAIAAAYCACLGIEGLARAGTVVFWLFVVLFVLMAVVNEGRVNWLNLRPFVTGDTKKFWDYIIESLSSSWWLPMLCALGVHLRSGAGKTAYGYLVMKLIIIETLMLLVTLILWRYIGVLGYPIFALGAFAKSGFIQRFDAINMLIWAINCTLVTGVYTFISARPLKKHKLATVISAAVAAAFAIYEFKRGLRYDESWFLIFKLSGALILGVIIPIAAGVKLIIRKSVRGPITDKREAVE